LLKEAVPNVSRVAVFWNPVNDVTSHYVAVLRGASEKLGVVLQPQAISDPDQFVGAFATIVAGGAQALVVVIDPLTVRYRERIAELATKNRLPAMYGFRELIAPNRGSNSSRIRRTACSTTPETHCTVVVIASKWRVPTDPYIPLCSTNVRFWG